LAIDRPREKAVAFLKKTNQKTFASGACCSATSDWCAQRGLRSLLRLSPRDKIFGGFLQKIDLFPGNAKRSNTQSELKLGGSHGA
jgi:hypothetical protein